MVENKVKESLEGVKVIHSEEYMKRWFLNNGKSNFPACVSLFIYDKKTFAARGQE